MRHKYKYTYKPPINYHKYIWFTVKLLLWLAVIAWALRGVVVGYQSIPQPAIAQEPFEVITNDHYTVTAITSAYTKIETCPNTECITASGTRPQAGVSVACPRDIPLGTKIEIAGQEYTCEDRTHSRFDGRYDLYMGDTEQAWLMAKEYGLQEHLIKIYY